MGASGYDKANRDPDADSALSLSERRSIHISEKEKQLQEQEQEQEQQEMERRGGQHRDYRGITFEEILPPHLITNAPPPDVEVEQKRGLGHHRRSTTTTTTTSTEHAMTETKTSPEPRTPTKRSYPSLKRHSSGTGGKSRFHATARALVRHFTITVPKRDSRRRSGGYEVV